MTSDRDRARWLVRVWATQTYPAAALLRRLGFKPAKSGKSWWRRYELREQVMIAIGHCRDAQLHGRATLDPVPDQKANRRLIERYRKAPAPQPTNMNELEALSRHLRALPQRNPREVEFRRAHSV